jgi:hypothetical protein
MAAFDSLSRATVASAAQTAPQPPYLGQPTPGLTPARFAPGVVSTDDAIELNGVFTPDGREFFFTRLVDKIDTMFHARFADGKWSAPRPLMVYANEAKAVAVDMAVSPDGKELYFLGQHAHSSNRPGSHGRSDVYRAQRLAAGGFAEPVNIGPPINTEHSEGDTFVAPDESYLILTSTRPGGLGQGDLYVSFRGKDGRWQPPVSLGDTINTDQTEFCPMVTPDGKYLFFSRRWGATWEQTTAGDVYWVDAKVLDRFRR